VLSVLRRFWRPAAYGLILIVGSLAYLLTDPAQIPAARPSAGFVPPTLEPLPTFDGNDVRQGYDSLGLYPIPPDVAHMDADQLCAALHAAWDRDWGRVVAVLKVAEANAVACDGKNPRLMLYPAYYNHGVLLERRGDIPNAITAYRNALVIQPTGREAATALLKYDALTPPPPPTCSAEAVAAAQLPPYEPVGTGDFVRLAGGAFTVDGQPFRVRGVNYYPSTAPWRRFLTDTDLDVAAQELDLIAGAGLNTIRVFLWYEALFDCPGSGVVPKLAAFARLEGVIRLAWERGLRVLVTLNDLPDLLVRPLYTFPEVADAQTAYIVSRYRDEPAILAWDLRNEGDIDYIRGHATSRTVINWLRNLSAAVRRIDPNHLITAGWNEGSQITDSAVDFLSFHHWRTSENLRQRIATFRNASRKPILLQEIGYPARGAGGPNPEAAAVRLRESLTVAESDGLLGWLVWTAFDFPTTATCVPPACPSPDNSEHHFGLWTTDYRPKPAARIVAEIVNQFLRTPPVIR
jgi:hypothetical protein